MSVAETALPTGCPARVFSSTLRVTRDPPASKDGLMLLLFVVPRLADDHGLVPSSFVARTSTSYVVRGSSSVILAVVSALSCVTAIQSASEPPSSRYCMS